jgi:hypothetical protein
MAANQDLILLWIARAHQPDWDRGAVARRHGTECFTVLHVQPQRFDCVGCRVHVACRSSDEGTDQLIRGRSEMGKRSYIAAAVLGALWLASLEAKAAAIVYVDRTLFEAATPTRTNLDFGTLTGGQDFVSYPIGAGPALMGASFRTDPTLPDSVKPQILFALAPSTKYNSVAEGLLASESQYPDFRPMDLLITLPAGVKSVGFDYAGGFTLASVNLSDGETFPLTQPVSPNVNFFGFTSTVNITG